MTTNEIAAKLGTEHVCKHKGQFKYWQSYYWGVTKDADALVKKVKDTFPNAVITGSGNHYHAFVGGAASGSAKDSYLWVTFTFPDTKIKDEPTDAWMGPSHLSP